GAKLVLVRHNHAAAVFQTTERLCEIKSSKSHLHRARVHNSSVHNQCLIHKKSARWHQKRIFVGAGDNVHFAGHSNHQIVRWIFHLQHNRVTLGGGIGGRLDGSDACGEHTCSVSVQLHFRPHPRFHFAHIFLVHFAANVIPTRRNREKL